MNSLSKLGFLVTGGLLLVISSCCSPDTDCAAGSPDVYKDSPYQPGQRIVFADSANRQIGVQLANSYISSDPYIIKGSCASMQKEHYCEATSELKASQVTDSANIIQSQYENFGITLRKDGYHLGAFEWTVGLGTQEAQPWNYDPLPTYTTPYRTYTNVFKSKITNNISAIDYRKRVVIDAKGRLLSFNVNKDTTHIFYVVE